MKQFGQYIGWGTTSSVTPVRQIGHVDRGGLKALGVTQEMAQEWADFYRNEAARVPGNPSAPGRAVLMQFIADLLK